MRDLDRRDFLRMGAALGGLFLARPVVSLASELLPQDSFGVSRASRLLPGVFTVHADLHNHSLFSGDAVGDARAAFEQMRDAGLDVAAMTDHAVMGKHHGDAVCATGACTGPFGQVMAMTESEWQSVGAFADAADTPGAFTAIRGFEWTTGTLGHVNVWFTQTWTDPFQTRGLVTPKALPEFFNLFPFGPQVNEIIGPVVDATPEVLATTEGLYDWLNASPDQPVTGGGLDGIAGFNHPNLFGNFNDFRFFPQAVDRLVTCEALNGFDDYLFFRAKPSQPEPINAILNAGWRIGMIGVSDEHGPQFGDPLKARGGLLVKDLSRAGVREALEARRVFASRVPGLRLDAAANGRQMGRRLPHRDGSVRFQIDIAKGGWTGRPLKLQVLRPGTDGVTVAAAADFAVPATHEPLVEITVDIDIEDGRWVLIRITDLARPPDAHLPPDIAAYGGAVAYTSPWFLTPGRGRGL